MRKVNELRQELSNIKNQMKSIVELATKENRAKTDEETSKFNQFKAEVKAIEDKIDNELFLLDNSKEEVKKSATVEKKSLGEIFKEKITLAVDSNRNISFTGAEMRADPIATNTDAGLINKLPSGPLNVMKTPARSFLDTLGVKVLTGLTGNVPLPNMGQLDASIVGEGVAISSFNAAPATVTLVSNRISKKQSFNVEYLSQSNPKHLEEILQDMIDSAWRAAVKGLFTNLPVDASLAEKAKVAGSYASVTALAASVPYEKAAPAFVAPYAVAGKMKTTAALTNQAAIWQGLYENGTVDGYKAYANSAVTDKYLIFGDWSKAYVGVWAEPTIIIDPLTERDNGKIKFIVEAQMDSAIADYRAFAFYKDASFA